MSDRVLFEACPLCGSRDHEIFALGDCSNHPSYHHSLESTIRWHRCSGCTHVFTEGYYTDAACQIIFGKTQDNQKVGGPIESNRQVSARMIEKVIPFVSAGKWLDVGFGNGSLLFTAEEYGFKPVGIDLRKENVDALRSMGIESYCQDLSNLTASEQFSVVSMADVLEHMPYPGKALFAANNLLRENGVLFVSMPNTENILWRELDRQHQNPYWGEMEHYHNFSRSRLYSLLMEHGFEPVRYGISERYRACMEVVSIKRRALQSLAAVAP